MSKKNKLQKFEDLKSLENVFEFPENIKGQWNEKVFKNEHPITLELACGKGDYTLALAEQQSERNFIGIDIKGARIWVGANKGKEKGLSNAVFLRTYIEQLTDYFYPHEVEDIWITFPDPFLKKSKARKRLTSPRFLKMYKHLLSQGGKVHLKTDSSILFDFTMETLEEHNINILSHSRNIYAEDKIDPLLEIQTEYERKHLRDGRDIHYLRFNFRN